MFFEHRLSDAEWVLFKSIMFLRLKICPHLFSLSLEKVLTSLDLCFEGLTNVFIFANLLFLVLIGN